MPGFPVHHQLPEFAQTHVHRVGDAIQLSSSCPFLLLPSIFPSIRVFSSESILHIRWSKNWSFSFSISPYNEYLGLISFRIDWFDLLAVQGILNTLLYHHSSNKGATRKLLEHISGFVKVAAYKINTQKYITFLYTNQKISKRKIQEAILFIVASKIIKYLGINLPKETKEKPVQ